MLDVNAKLVTHPEVLNIAKETYKFRISPKDLKFIKYLPIDIRLIQVENILSKYTTTYSSITDVFNIWSSFGLIKEYIRVFIAGVSDNPMLFKKAEYRSHRGIQSCCLSRYIGGETHLVLEDRVPNIHPYDAKRCIEILNQYILTELQEFIFWNTLIRNNVVVFDIGSNRNLELFSLGEIESFRYKELGRGVLHFQGVSEDGKLYIDD